MTNPAIAPIAPAEVAPATAKRAGSGKSRRRVTYDFIVSVLLLGLGRQNAVGEHGESGAEIKQRFGAGAVALQVAEHVHAEIQRHQSEREVTRSGQQLER